MKKTHIPVGYYTLDAGRKGERGRLLGVKTLFPNAPYQQNLFQRHCCANKQGNEKAIESAVRNRTTKAEEMGPLVHVTQA